MAVVVVASVSDPAKHHTHVAMLDLKRRDKLGCVTVFKQKHFLASFVALSRQAVAESGFGRDLERVDMLDFDSAKISSSLSFYWGQLGTGRKNSADTCTDIQV